MLIHAILVTLDGMNNYTWIELNKTYLEHNIAQYKQAIGPKRALACVVKSNAYGHGVTEISPLVGNNKNVDYICTATIAESLELRALRITKPLLVLYPDITKHTSDTLKQNIAFSISSLRAAQELNKAAQKTNSSVKIHLKIDTGMHRFGFYPQQILQEIETITKLSHICIEGIYTHFANADSADPTYTNQQIKAFFDLVKTIQSKNITIKYIHMANSAATTTTDLLQSNMVRVGAGLYGLWASAATKERTKILHPNFELQQVLTWKTRVSDIKIIPKDAYVGYRGTYHTTKETKVVHIPIGYHDGYHRRLSNCGIVLINGMYLPIIGRISMNVITAVVPEQTRINVHDIVTILGAEQHVSATDMASIIGSFNPREVTVRLNPNIPRMVV